MKTITFDQYLSFLNSFGLSISESSGGHQPTNIRVNTVDLTDTHPILNLHGGAPIVFMEPELFLLTISATETSLQIKLFH